MPFSPQSTAYLRGLLTEEVPLCGLHSPLGTLGRCFEKFFSTSARPLGISEPQTDPLPCRGEKSEPQKSLKCTNPFGTHGRASPWCQEQRKIHLKKGEHLMKAVRLCHLVGRGAVSTTGREVPPGEVGTEEAGAPAPGGQGQNHGQDRASLVGVTTGSHTVVEASLFPIPQKLIFLFPPLSFLPPLCAHLLPSWARRSVGELLVWNEPCLQSWTPQRGSAQRCSLGAAWSPPWAVALGQAGPATTAQGEEEGELCLHRWPATCPSTPKLSATLPPPQHLPLVWPLGSAATAKRWGQSR